MSVPTLHEIAAMPFPASLNAMREHYNKDWGRPVPEDSDGELRTYLVSVSYSIRDLITVEVEAYSEDEARDLAEDEAQTRLGDGKDFCAEDVREKAKQ